VKARKAVLLVEPTKKAMNRTFNELSKPSKKYSGIEIISFPDFETLGRVIAGARLELLHVIRLEKPKSIQELARLVERDFKNVYQDVALLSNFGLIDLKKVGPRKSVAPTAKFSEIVLAPVSENRNRTTALKS
jgi:predicted transcriptional regulator